MSLLSKGPKTEKDLVEIIQNNSGAMLFHSSKTSTVIPYEVLESLWKNYERPMTLVNLSQLTPRLELDDQMNLVFSGGVSFKEAREFLRSKGRDLAVAPTEELALLYGGISTSATGEYSFAYRALREWVVEVEFINYKGQKKIFKTKDRLQKSEFFKDPQAQKILCDYQNDYLFYQKFKNAPFPRFEFESDLLVGTEGQLGAIVGGKFRTVPLFNTSAYFIKLPKWHEDCSPHLEILEKVQLHRGDILISEFLDGNSFRLSGLNSEFGLDGTHDVMFFEIKSDCEEKIFEQFFFQLKSIKEEDIFQLSKSQFDTMRREVPRRVWEQNLKNQVTKKGTDVQVSRESFKDLLQCYIEAYKLNIPCLLFGHFGDCHLHFNFLPNKDQVPLCDQYLENLYKKVELMRGSPFAEHGIGLLKQKFIAPFYGQHQLEMFRYLKGRFDPENKFFPQGFMSIII